MNTKHISSMAKRLWLLCLLLCGSMGAGRVSAQLTPVINMPSPQIAGLGEFETIPVGCYTGMPHIAIPLHEMHLGQKTFPIQAAYHLASVKPGNQGSCIGLGWNLQAGGYITRTVNGCYDEKQYADGTAIGYYANAYRLKGMNCGQFQAATEQIAPHVGKPGVDPTVYELAADEFSFSFFGYSGTFYYNPDGGWTVISEQPIRVEFNPSGGFVSLDGLRPEINTARWNMRSTNNRFFNKFTLITPDGWRYEFGGIYATEYSVPYYTRNSSDLVATSWHLSRITSPEGYEVKYTYQATELMCDLKYMPQLKEFDGMYCTAKSDCRGRNAMTGFLLMPVRLASIETPEELVTFDYFFDYAYSGFFHKDFLGWRDSRYYNRADIYSSADAANDFGVFFPKTMDMSSDAKLQESIQEHLRRSILHRIAVCNKLLADDSKSVYFEYTFNNRRKPSKIVTRRGIPELEPDYVMGEGMLVLRGYKIPESTTPHRDIVYSFEYNTGIKLPLDFIKGQTDYWGYYTGGEISFAAIPTFMKPAPSLNYAKAEVLEGITYPTGGRQTFEYELHRYSQVVKKSNLGYEGRLGTAGGLRVKSISRTDGGGKLIDKKQYAYTFVASDVSSGFLNRDIVYGVVYDFADKKGFIMQTTEGPIPTYVTNHNSPTVSYPVVKEETFGADGQLLGGIEREYTNFEADIYGIGHLNESPVCSTAGGESPVKPFTSRSLERGKLLREDCYDGNRKTVKTKRVHYAKVSPSDFLVAHQYVLHACSDVELEKHCNIGALTRVYTHGYLPDSIVEVTYGTGGSSQSYHTYKAMDYNDRKLLKQERVRTAKGGVRKVSYLYPTDFADYQWMTDANYVALPVVKETEEDGKAMMERYTYAKVPAGRLPYIEKAESVFDKHDTRTDYEVTLTDKYGNPVVVEAQGATTLYLWSCRGRKLIAKLENADYDNVSSLLGQSPENLSNVSSPDASVYEKIEGIRHLLPKSEVTVYKYRGGRLLESVTQPNGQTVYYKYDYLDRLREEYFFDMATGTPIKKVLKMYDYQYAQ